jgi:hypothetical protein
MFGTRCDGSLTSSRMVVGRHYGLSQGVLVQPTGLKKAVAGSWRVLDRYRRAANPDVVGFGGGM